MLYSQGHSDDVCRIESVTEVRLEMDASGDVYLPSNIIPGVFSHAVMDNINEDNRSGQGTTHVLGSLIYQDIRRKSI